MRWWCRRNLGQIWIRLWAEIWKILNRNLNEICTKSIRFCDTPHRFPDFRKFWNVRGQISVRKLKNFGKISIRFGTEMNQISVRNLFEMWSEFVCHADQHKNESTSVNGRKSVVKCVRQSARFLEDSNQIWNGNLIDFCSKSDSNLWDFYKI